MFHSLNLGAALSFSFAMQTSLQKHRNLLKRLMPRFCHGDNCAVSQAKLLSVHEVLGKACLNRLGLQEAEMKSKKQAKWRLSLLFGVKLHGVSIFSIKN